MKRWIRPMLCLAVALAGVASVRAAEFDSAGVKIHYTLAGKGDPVVLVHGLYSSGAINWEWPGSVAALTNRHQVVTFDCRGHGLSGKPETEDAYGVQMAEDVVRLMDHLKLKKARVAGYSMGGMITMKLLTLHPDRVTSAVLGGMGWLQAGSPLQKFWELVLARSELPQPVPNACLRALGKLAVTETEVKAVKVPVTIIVGDRDPCLPLYVEPLRKIRPDWPVHIIKDAGHLMCVVKPEFKTQLADVIAPFISRPR